MVSLFFLRAAAEATAEMNTRSSNCTTPAITYTPHVGPGPESAEDEGIEILAKQLIERLRPFVNAGHPGSRNDPDVLAFEEEMKKEAENMKLEKYGIEVFFFFHLTFIGRLRMFARSSCTQLDRCTRRKPSRSSSHTQRYSARCEPDYLAEWNASPSIFSSSGFYSFVKDVLGIIESMYVLIDSHDADGLIQLTF